MGRTGMDYGTLPWDDIFTSYAGDSPRRPGRKCSIRDLESLYKVPDTHKFRREFKRRAAERGVVIRSREQMVGRKRKVNQKS